ncbi:MAG: orotate phosphoribosyltransferase [Gammaproteobacteria bacterium]|nr:orotate phosphoribosyltransferase [Gammaproteobacteria bacterium]
MTDAVPPGAEDFIRAMLEREALLFGDFVLKSGRRSPYFFNLGTVADGAGHDVVGKAYAKEVVGLAVQPDVLFGPAYKGIPVAVSVAVALARDYGVNIGAAFNRKEAKTHGEGGTLVGASMAGSRVVIVDDVVTDGAAKREAHGTITAAGGEVVGIVLALDRQEPSTDSGETAVAALERDLQVPVRCVANLDDVIAFLASDGGFENERKALLAHRIRSPSAISGRFASNAPNPLGMGGL